MIANFEIFGRTFGIYPIVSIIGIFVCGIYACKKAKQVNLDENDMIIFLLMAAIGVWIGGHLLYGFTNYQQIIYLLENIEKVHSLKQLFQYIVYLFGGSVFYGGLLGGMCTAYVYGRKKRLDLQKYADILASAVPLFHIFGRIGCFLGGCCYGVQCKIGFIYHHSPIPDANGISRFPVQLLESGFNLVLFLWLSHLLKKKVGQGRLFVYYLMSYAAGRFFFEFLRGDELRGFFGQLSTSQWISIFLFVACLVWLKFFHRSGYPIKRKKK